MDDQPAGEVFRYDATIRRILVSFVSALWVLTVVLAVVVPDDPAAWFVGSVGAVFTLITILAFRCRITIDDDSLTCTGFVHTTTVRRDDIERIDIASERRPPSPDAGIAIYRMERSIPMVIDASHWDRTGDLTRTIRAWGPRPEDDPPRRDPPAWLQRRRFVQRAMAREEQRRRAGMG